MAHAIDVSTGSPAMAYVGAKPWHGLGERLPDGASIETWLGAARLDWNLNRLPVQSLVNGTLRTMEDRFVLVRSDTHAALSVVSSEYQIVQPGEVLEFYRDLTKMHGYSLETAGALDGGRKVWALARTGISNAVDDEGKDEIAAYVLLATSCDKTLATTAAFTSIRVVCQNTLFFAMEDVRANSRPKIKVSHNHRFDGDSVKTQLSLVDKAWSEFIGKVRRMAGRRMMPDEASSFFKVLLLQNKSGTLSKKAQREHEAILALFGSAPGGELNSAKGTLWGALNAVTYYSDHVRSVATSDRLDSASVRRGLCTEGKSLV